MIKKISKIKNPEHGAVMMWLAIMVVALFSIFALAFDFSINSSSEEEQTYTSEYLALAAMETYATANVSSYDLKVEKARARVSKLAGENFLLGRFSGESQSEADGDITATKNAQSSEMGVSGTVIPGKWFSKDPGCLIGSAPSTIDSCPCAGTGGSFTGPCFRPNILGNIKANAFKVKLKSNKKLDSWFSKVFGSTGSSPKAAATATIVPRETILLLDLSRSMQMDTHPMTKDNLPGYPDDISKGVEYSWRLNEEQLPPSINGYCNGYGNPFPNKGPSQYSYPKLINEDTSAGISYSPTYNEFTEGVPSTYCNGERSGNSLGSDADCTKDPSALNMAMGVGNYALCNTIYDKKTKHPIYQKIVMEKTTCRKKKKCCTFGPLNPLRCPSDSSCGCTGTPNSCAGFCDGSDVGDPCHIATTGWNIIKKTALSCWWELNTLVCPFEATDNGTDNDSYAPSPPGSPLPNKAQIIAGIDLTFKYNDNTDGPTPTSKFGTTHHKADYRCFTAHGIDYDNDTVEDKYLIDVAHNAHYKGPQPLTDILEGSYEAIKIIEKRAINEDKLGVIGFDSSMKNVTQRCIGLTNYKGPQFNTIKRIFYPGIHGFSYIADIQQRVDHLFFPRYEFNSSLLLGLRWAGYLFSKRSCSLVEAAINADESHSILFPPVKDLSKNEYTKKSVILFTDGLSNCTYTDCSLSHWSTHWESIKDDLSPIVKSYADSDIPINLMLFGRAIAPHNLLMRKSSGGCLSDYEARENDLIYTDGDPYLSPGGGSPTDKLSLSFSQLIHLWGDDITTGPNMYMLDDPYFFPNSYLNNNVSIPTKGRFAPIRPPCKHTHLGFSTRAECVKKGNQVLNNICNTYPSSTFSKNAITRLTDTSRIIAPPLTDNFGRLVCDPNCRGSKDQVKSIIREIYSFSPYMLVE